MKNVLVTGSGKGLGASLIKEFAKNNYNVIITYNNSYEEAFKLKNEVETIYKVNVEILKCDISNEDDIINLFNNYDIDILINNASLSMDLEIMDKSKDEFMKVLEVNLVGTFLMCKEAVKRGIKDIINISSTDSIDTYNSLNIDYSSSKAGVNIVTKTIANAYSNVRIFAVLPNFINTESIMEMNEEYLNSELKRIGQEKLLDKEEVASTIYKLYKDENIKSGSLVRIDYEGGLCIQVLEYVKS